MSKLTQYLTEFMGSDRREAEEMARRQKEIEEAKKVGGEGFGTFSNIKERVIANTMSMDERDRTNQQKDSEEAEGDEAESGTEDRARDDQAMEQDIQGQADAINSDRLIGTGSFSGSAFEGQEEPEEESEAERPYFPGGNPSPEEKEQAGFER